MNLYLVMVLVFIVGEYVLSLVVETLNLRCLSPTVPTEFTGFYDTEKYKQSQLYLKENMRVDLVMNTVSLLIIIPFILFGGFNTLDLYVRRWQLPEIATGLVFTALLLFGTELVKIPFSIYHTFVIEQKYGFNRTTGKTFILDLIKKWLLFAIFGGLIYTFILWFFLQSGTLAWVYCWIAVILFQLFMEFIAPVVILPIFNKFVPIEDGELKQTIEDYAQKEKFALRGIYKMDASRRSAKSNAFFIGFGKFRRIVLYDTLIAKHTVDELVAVLAHEMGHYKKQHILKFFCISVITTGLMFYILSLFINNHGLFTAFKMDTVSVYASLVFFAFLFTPINLIVSVITNIFSRRYEYAADKYAAITYQKPDAMVTALKKLSTDNLSNLTPHPVKVFLEYSHPPVLDRIRAIQTYKL